MAEYIIIVIVVAAVVLLGIRYFGGTLFGQFENATHEITAARDESRSPSISSAPESRPGGSGAPGGGPGSLNSGASSSLSDSGTNSRVEALRPPGVGSGGEVEDPTLNIDAGTLQVLAAFVVLIGIGIIASLMKKTQGKEKQKKKKKRFSLLSPKKGEEGQAMAEFVIVCITFLFVILGVIQFAMVLNAQSLVRYAAYNAARAAIVHGVDKEKMREAARLSLVATFPKHGRADHVRGFAENYLAARTTDSLPVFDGAITEVTVLDNNGLDPGDTVTFDDPASPHPQTITVQVVHRYELVIPLVNRILYYVYTRFISGAGYHGEHLDRLSQLTNELRQPGGEFYDIEYRIALVAHYTMRLQSDYEVP